MKRSDIDEFVACFNPENRRAYSYEELIQRDKVSLNIFWLKDDDLEGEDKEVDLDLLMATIAEDLRAALAQFEVIQTDLATH